MPWNHALSALESGFLGILYIIQISMYINNILYIIYYYIIYIWKHYSSGVWTPNNKIYICCSIYFYICLMHVWRKALHLFAFVVAFVVACVYICCGICLHLLLHLLWHFFAFVVAFVYICCGIRLHLLWHVFTFVVAFVCICCCICLHLLWHFFALAVTFVLSCSAMFYIYVCKCTDTNCKCWNKCNIRNKCKCI